jgi:hypothetical protein
VVIGVPQFGLDGHKIEFGVVGVDFAWEKSPSIRVHAEEGKWEEVKRPQ